MAAGKWSLMCELFYCLMLVFGVCLEVSAERQERSLALAFPSGSVIKLIMNMVIPVTVDRSILHVNTIQFFYMVPVNASQYEASLRRRRTPDALLDRDAVYKALEGVLDREGVNGSACVLRTICEVAETPLHHDGLLGELIQLIFTPRSGERASGESYTDAWRRGNDGVDCSMTYPWCEDGHGVLEYISAIAD